MATNVAIIVGSVRQERVGRSIAEWVMQEAGKYEGSLSFSLVDLKEVNLPFMDEPVPPRMSSEYVHEHTRQWSAMMRAADALILVTPEYNHGYSPALKNAIDYLYEEWQGKPVAFVGYGGAGATNAIAQLRDVLDTVGMNALSYQVTIGRIWEALDDAGNVKQENVRGDLQQLFKTIEDVS
jgi:NAD(P)H-dependent FMN reductase